VVLVASHHKLVSMVGRERTTAERDDDGGRRTTTEDDGGQHSSHAHIAMTVVRRA